jgi:cyclase
MKHRIIPTLLTSNNSLVKGTCFNNWRTVGSISAAANLYASRDVDELIVLDVNARNREAVIDTAIVDMFSSVLRVPLSVGGGVNSVQDATRLLNAGAEKIILGTSAFENPNLISEIANKFGTQAVCVTIDIPSEDPNELCINSGKQKIKMKALKFAEECVGLGAGEIIVQSVSRDGTRQGMDINLIKQFCDKLSVPVVASSGAGCNNDFLEAIRVGASAVAAGSIFQFTETTPLMIKSFLKSNGVLVRES